MRKMCLTFVLFLTLLSPVFWAETLSDTDQALVEKFAKKAEDIIEEKWEAQRDFIVFTLEEFSQRGDVKESTATAVKLLAEKIKANKWNIAWGKEFDDLHIDKEEIKLTWLDWLNTERKLVWRDPYVYNPQLEKTALAWSEFSKDKWVIDHKVSPWDSYYDYSKKSAWMKQHGVVCKNTSGFTFTESIAWEVMRCTDWECTQEFKNAMKKWFDFFMSEKWKSYKPHYDAIINKQFTMLWLGIALQKTGNGRYKYYLTNHYCTQVL